MNKKQLITGIICTLAGGTLWGFSGACGEFLTRSGMTSGYITPLRLALAGVILLVSAFLCARGKLIEIFSEPKDLVLAVLFGVMGVLPSGFFYLSAIEYSNAGTATVLQYTGPALIIVYICLRYRRKPRLSELVSLLLAMGGVFIIATHGNPSNLAISDKALIYGMLSALALVFYTVLPEKIIPKYGSVVVTGIGMLSASVLMMLIARPWSISCEWELSQFAAFIGMVVPGTVFAFTLYIKGVGLIGSSKASMISCVEPVSAAVISALWFSTSFAPMDYVGFAMILLTVILLGKK